MHRWLFRDHLGPHFLPDDRTGLLIESTEVLRRTSFHRQKVHLLLVAMRARARELGDRAVHHVAPTYREVVASYDDVEVAQPTSRAAAAFVATLPQVRVVPSPFTATSRDEFIAWSKDRARWRMEDFYRQQRRRYGVLMEGDAPVGGRWNLDHDNREPPPKGAERLPVAAAWRPREDDLDAEVRDHLDRLERDGHARFRGVDGPRLFAATRDEALAALDQFIAERLPSFGPWEDAMLRGDWAMAHSQLSPALNLGLLDPLEVVHAAEDALRRGDAPLGSVEGFIRQIIGWREYVHGVYWATDAGYADSNVLHAHTPLPRWFWDLDAEAVEAACLADVLEGVRDRGWVHHIQRLMVLGSWALQRGYDPRELSEWFATSFVDGYEWVMAANVVGMSQHADGGLMASKPYTSGGAYLNRMSDYCGSCRYRPTVRVGDDACPYTAGYWWFLDRSSQLLENNPRMRTAVRGLHRLVDLPELVAQERARGDAAP